MSARNKLKSNPENDRDKRKAALQAAREKLAMRKRQREELRQQRAARLNGKIDTLSSFQATSASASAKSASSTINKLNQSTSIRREKPKPLLDLDDFKEKPSVPNKASLLRAPRKRSQLSESRMDIYRFPNGLHPSPVANVATKSIGIETDFDMFTQYLMEQYSEEFTSPNDITDEVKANLIFSKYKMGWPKELWMHEKSLSPSPQNLMYGDDDEFIEQQKKIQLLRQQEKERKQRQFEMIQERRKIRLERKKRMLLPENEANLLINTGDFMENFRRKTKWMERTLGINSTSFISDLITSGVDIIAQQYDDSKYDQEEEPLTGNNNSTTSQPKVRRASTINLQRRKRKNLLRYANKFSTTETEGRAIGDINFSATNTDWFLASYFTKNEEEIGKGDNEGCILVWNLILPSFPEYKLYSQSMITSTHFHPTDKFLVFASTISGQVLCYDLRIGGESKPVQRTNFSDGHSSAIFSMDFLQSATNSKTDRRHILSVSNDGKLCIWKDDGLDEKPMHEGILQLSDSTKVISNDQLIVADKDDEKSKKPSVTVSTGGGSTSQELATTCFGYQHKHSDNVLFGSDSGKIYRTDIHGSNATEEHIYVQQSIEAHFGPITNIDFPKYTQNTGISKIPTSISGLYLTSSYDWSVKLWHSDYQQSIETYTQMTDYVYDVKWCNGGKPGVFATVDGESNLNLFDLKYDFKEPIHETIKVPTRGNESALTKLQWGNNGKYLSCGDSDGNIYLYISSKELLNPTNSDYDNLDKSLLSTIKSKGLTKQSK